MHKAQPPPQAGCGSRKSRGTSAQHAAFRAGKGSTSLRHRSLQVHLQSHATISDGAVQDSTPPPDSPSLPASTTHPPAPPTLSSVAETLPHAGNTAQRKVAAIPARVFPPANPGKTDASTNSFPQSPRQFFPKAVYSPFPASSKGFAHTLRTKLNDFESSRIQLNAER